MELFDRLVNETVSSGIEPVTLNFTGIYDCYSARPVAYRTETEMFSSVSGKIKEAAEKVDKTETGKNFTAHNIVKAIRCIKAMVAEKRRISWISVSATTAFLTQDDLYSALDNIFKAENFTENDKLCLEFSKSILTAEREKVLKGLADLKVLGVKTVISGVAADDFPTSALLDVAVDTVILTPAITGLALDRNKPGVLASLIRFLRSMDVSVIAEGVTGDDELRELNKAECFGFVPSENDSGRLTVIKGTHDFASALCEKEDA